MEFSHVGKHCSLKFCNLRDFLPYTCNYCSAVFCHEHFRPDSHKCKPYKKLQKKYKYKIKKKLKTKKFKRCFYKKCKEKLYNPKICTTCNNYFCISHRFHEKIHKSIKCG